jgi:excisionase family DNA binding protein
MDPSKEVMTVTEAAKYLGISGDTLYRYLGEGAIPAFKLGNRWRFKRGTLDRWLEAQIQQHTASPKKS